MFSLLSDTLVVFGPRRTDATVTRSDALVALGDAVDAKGKTKQHAKLRSSGVEVNVSAGGHSAWAFDVLQIDGHQLSLTAVLSNTDDLWAVTAAALAETPSTSQIKADAARDAIVPPGATAVAKVGAGTEAAIDKLKKGLLDQQSWGDDLANHDNAIVAGPSVGQVARGKQAVKRQWAARMKTNVREATSGDLAAQMSADGQLIWISVPVTRVADGEDPLPLRLFAIYEKTDATWSMVALHESLAIGEPGSGTPFKKILPPEPAKPEPPKAEEKKPDDTVAAKPAAKTKATKAKKTTKPKKKK